MSEASGSAGVPGRLPQVTGVRRLFIRKSVAQMHAEHAQSDLKRSLGALNLVLLGIGCIIGTGIFVLTGRAAADFAGPGIMISFVITGALCTFVALCYADAWRAWASSFADASIDASTARASSSRSRAILRVWVGRAGSFSSASQRCDWSSQ